MNHFIGLAYLTSMLVLTVVVAVVYSAAQEAFLSLPGLFTQAVKRGGKLLGVLLTLAVVVYFLGKI